MPDPHRVIVRTAGSADLPAIHPVIERAYRGESARGGWTHEADLVSGERIEPGALEDIIAGPDSRLLIAEIADHAVGCVSLTRQEGRTVYLGLLCVDPDRQAAGIAKVLLKSAEDFAGQIFHAQRIEMTVISVRVELVEYYERRGYRRTGELRPFVVPLDPPLEMIVLAKDLNKAASPDVDQTATATAPAISTPIPNAASATPT